MMAKARIGHFVEAQVLEALEVDYIDESEVLTPADEAHHIDKWRFKVPFVCGATNLGEALRRIAEGAAMIRSKGEAGTGNVVEAVRHIRADHRRDPPARGRSTRDGAADGRQGAAGAARAGRATWPSDGRLPVVLFCAGGIATPADAALMMQLGAEGNFVGSGIFKSSDPARRARAIVEATTHFDDPSAWPPPRASWARRCPGIEIGTLEAERRAAAEPRLVSAAPLIGVLALQGGFEAHAKALEELGARTRDRAGARDLDGLDGLVIPGGESTTMTLGHRARAARRAAARASSARGSPRSAPAPG